MTKVITFSKSTLRIKVMLYWALYFILLMSVVIQHLNFLRGEELEEYLLSCKCHWVHRPHFRKLLQSSNKENKNSIPSMVHIIFKGRWNIWLFFFKSVITFLWLYNCIDVLYHARNTSDVIYLCKFTHARLATFLKKHGFVKKTLLFDF